MKRFLCLLALASVACSQGGHGPDTTSASARVNILFTLHGLDALNTAMRDGHDSIATMYKQHPYSAAGRAAIHAAQDAWNKVKNDSIAFTSDMEAQNPLIPAAESAAAGAADAWLALLSALDITTSTHIGTDTIYYDNLTNAAEAKESSAFAAVTAAHDESLRQYCTAEAGIDSACDGVQTST